MSSSPQSNRYTDTHEWVRLDGEVATLGLTQHAVSELTDITYVEMHEPGEVVGEGESLGEVESVKATSDVYSPMAGEIVEINTELSDDPSLVNTDPFGEGWLIRIRPADPSALESLMDARAYDEKYPVS